jgi:membrane fusion protein (multidrug efflux system)
MRSRADATTRSIDTRKTAVFLTSMMAVLAVIVLALTATGCNKGDGAPQANAQSGQKGGHGGKGGPGGGGRPSQPPVPIAVQAAAEGAIASYYKATATLTAEKTAQVLARVNGVIKALGCEEGDVVAAGHVLLRVEDEEYVYRLQQAEAARSTAKDKFNRLKGMRDQDLVSAEQFEQARNELASAEAAEELARLTLSYANVEAPFRGFITRRHVDIGQTVSPGVPLFDIADFDPLLAIVHVPSKEFKQLKSDQPVRLTLDSTDQSLSGHIKLVSPIIDPTSGTIKVTIEISDYPANTRPGDFAEVSIVTERRMGSTLVPKTAVFTDRGDQIVYVAADSTAERRVVEVGFEDDENSEILNGVAEGEMIVVKGQRSLKHGSPIKIMEDRLPTPAQNDEKPAARQAGS